MKYYISDDRLFRVDNEYICVLENTDRNWIMVGLANYHERMLDETDIVTIFEAEEYMNRLKMLEELNK